MKVLLSSAAAMLMLVGISAIAGPGNVGSCTGCGTVQSIEPATGSGKSSGSGAVIGAVIGGVIGHQFGGNDRSRDAATVGGAVAGGVAGNEVEKKRNEATLYKVTVALDGGGTRAVNVRELNGLATGAKVRVSGENLEKL